MTRPTPTTTTSSQLTLTTLPGELRNEIFSLCITHALPHRRPGSPLPLTASISSPHHCTGHLILSNIRPLPLLFINKQTFTEVSSLLYALVEKVSLGPGISQYLDDDPLQRWGFAYSLVEKRPDIQKRAKSIEITLPRTPYLVYLKTYASLRKLPRVKEEKSNAVAILPGLENFLRKFESLEKVTVHFIAELKDQPPRYEDLLPLWKMFGERLKLEFKTRSTENQDFALVLINRDWTAWQEGWGRYVRELVEAGRVEG